MKKSSLKLYLATFLLTLALASVGFAGDGQCPLLPPPPPPEGVGSGNTGHAFNANYMYIKDFLKFFIKF
jgi:hypothetical protein